MTVYKYTESGLLEDFKTNRQLPFTQTFYYRIDVQNNDRNAEFLQIHEGINFPGLDNPMCIFELSKIVDLANNIESEAEYESSFEKMNDFSDDLWVRSAKVNSESDEIKCSEFLCGEDRYLGR